MAELAAKGYQVVSTPTWRPYAVGESFSRVQVARVS